MPCGFGSSPRQSSSERSSRRLGLGEAVPVWHFTQDMAFNSPLLLSETRFTGKLCLHIVGAALLKHLSRISFAIILILSGVAVSSVNAQQAKITVMEVKGFVQTRPAEDQAWKRATVGMELSVGADIRTGLRSAIAMTIGAEQTLVIDRMSTVKLLDAIQADGKIKTDLGMKYGRLKYEVKAAGEEVESRVIAPSATLAVRGSSVEMHDDALSSYARGSGRLAYLPIDRRSEITFGGNGEAEVNGEDDEGDAPLVSRRKSVINSVGMFAATNPQEFMNLLQKSGITDTNQRDVLEIQRLLGEIESGGIGVPQVNGPLTFNAFWITNDPFFIDAPDINLSIVDPLGNTLSAANPLVGNAPAQGLHFGDTAGAVNQEQAQWPGIFNLGTHNIVLDHVAGNDSVTITLTAFQGAGIGVSGLDGTNPPIILNPGQQIIVPATPVP